MVAALLHAENPRREAPFVVVDCASLDEELLRSVLFGHGRDAFPGATRQRHGLLEVAHGGTLFLEEVGDASREIHSKLLPVLETGRFRRLGGNREIHVNVRFVAATNRDPEAEIRKGRFREDLYFRLATLTLGVPRLRERLQDVPVLVEHYTKLLNRRFAGPMRFGDDAVKAMSAIPGPGTSAS
jgi:DNA-binding NtrC family response regulator